MTLNMRVGVLCADAVQKHCLNMRPVMLARNKFVTI